MHTAGVTRPLSEDHVLQIPHLSGLSRADAQHLAGQLLLLSFGPRELVVIEGQDCRGMYQLLSGRARLYRTAPDGREQIMRLLTPADTFGEVAVFDAGPMPATVETLEASEVILLPSDVFRRLVERQAGVAHDLLKHFARRLRSFTELVEQVSLQTVQQRVARYLYFAAREEGKPAPNGVVIERVITLQDLASLVGSVREVVSRTLHTLEVEGIVEVRRREIVVLDMGALRSLL
jgi:CRP/FNR family cyclic AMP-dependent transcriptional regulator